MAIVQRALASCDPRLIVLLLGVLSCSRDGRTGPSASGPPTEATPIDGAAAAPIDTTDETSSAAAAAAASAAPSESPPARCEDDPGFTPGPPIRPVRGAPPFEVFCDCVWPNDAAIAIGVTMTKSDPITRAQADLLVNDVLAQAKRALGSRFPGRVSIGVYPHGTRAWLGNYLARLMLSGDKEEDEEEGAGIEKQIPASLLDLRDQLRKDIAIDFADLAPKVRVALDQGRRQTKVEFPYGKEHDPLTYARAVEPLFRIAIDYYRFPDAEPKRLLLTGIWKSKPVLRIQVADREAFRAMDPLARFERVRRAKDAPGASPSSAEATARTEYAAALAALPRGSVWADASLEP